LSGSPSEGEIKYPLILEIGLLISHYIGVLPASLAAFSQTGNKAEQKLNEIN
jgi:hypothetical protein